MPVPESAADLVSLGCKAGILEERTATDYCARLLSSGTNLSPQQLAQAMIRDGLLTPFQAKQLLAGRWKGFILAKKYRLLERIGSGGMGAVYVCEHLTLRRRVALKILPTSQAQDPDNLVRFYREARAVAALSHPNIVRAHDIDQDGKLHFLVMEYIDGNSLQKIVKKHGAMHPMRVINYIAQAATGLQHAHQAGLVHRDIKPANLLLDRNGTIKILDLGLARFFHEDDDTLTRKNDNAVLGTADYLAPEQAIDSHSADNRADIYSLGATMYFLLAGHPPFPGGTVGRKLIAHQTEEPVPIESLRSDLPPELPAILSKMLAKKPEDRFQKPIEIVEAFGALIRGPIGPPPEHEMPRTRWGGPHLSPRDSAEARLIEVPDTEMDPIDTTAVINTVAATARAAPTDAPPPGWPSGDMVPSDSYVDTPFGLLGENASDAAMEPHPATEQWAFETTPHVWTRISTSTRSRWAKYWLPILITAGIGSFIVFFIILHFIS